MENPFKFLRITADPGCNFACIYCNPKKESNPNMMTTSEVIETVRAGFQLGIKIVHLTGGEPTKRKDIVELVAGIKNEGVETIEMTTNGALFYKMAENLANAGLTGVNISLDTLNQDKFKLITGVDALHLVLGSIEKARNLFGSHVSINMVVMKDNLDEMRDFVEFSRKTGVMVRFCELTPQGPYMEASPDFFAQNHVPKEDILNAIREIAPIDDLKRDQFDKQNAHSEYYTLGGEYQDMTIGIIAPFSNGWPCPGAGCTRLRIGPTGGNSCVIYPERRLIGLTFEEKKIVIRELIDERRHQMDNNLFPAQHEAEYGPYRFGLLKKSPVEISLTSDLN
ncbi:MAG: radical SAM protein [Candidatus Roizmanbacteria bacterium]|nr:radical SAM protein [Candidatus Roizmanbacteria bacterium]